MIQHPTIQLSNGLRIANFSSPHSFVFTTGEELPACSPEVANELKLDIQEMDISPAGQAWTDIRLSIQMTAVVQDALVRLSWRNSVDIIIVPLMVRQALTERIGAVYQGLAPALSPLGIANDKARVCRVADRVTKTIYPDKFSV